MPARHLALCRESHHLTDIAPAPTFRASSCWTPAGSSNSTRPPSCCKTRRAATTRWPCALASIAASVLIIAQGQRATRVQGAAEDGAGPCSDDLATGQADPRLDQACSDACDHRQRQPGRAEERGICVELPLRSVFDNVHSMQRVKSAGPSCHRSSGVRGRRARCSGSTAAVNVRRSGSDEGVVAGANDAS